MGSSWLSTASAPPEHRVDLHQHLGLVAVRRLPVGLRRGSC